METRVTREAAALGKGAPLARAAAADAAPKEHVRLPGDGLKLTGGRIDAARAQKALVTALAASKGEETRIRSGIASLDPSGVSGAGDPVVRDLMASLELLEKVRGELGAARDAVSRPVEAIAAANRALDAHVAMFDMLKEARRNLHEGSYGRLAPSEEATLEDIDDALRAAIFTQTRIVLAQDALENP